MAHFARLDADSIVTEVLVVDNVILGTPENEAKGIKWLEDFDTLRGLNPAQWVQTSYNGKFRGCYAGIGMTYDVASNTFVAPKPPESDNVAPIATEVAP